VTAVTDVLGVTGSADEQREDDPLQYLTDNGTNVTVDLTDYDTRNIKLHGLFALSCRRRPILSTSLNPKTQRTAKGTERTEGFFGLMTIRRFRLNQSGGSMALTRRQFIKADRPGDGGELLGPSFFAIPCEPRSRRHARDRYFVVNLSRRRQRRAEHGRPYDNGSGLRDVL